MALHYIVDGYNVIKKTPFLNHHKLKDARDALLSFIDTYRPQGSPKNKITVVFDGKEGFCNFNHNFDIHVIFAKAETADDLIKSLVDKSLNQKNIVVVSDDRDIMFHCRPQGAKILLVNEFISTANKRAKVNNNKSDDSIELTHIQQKKITEELGRIWLK